MNGAPGFTVIAHRGASALAPENTLAAMRLAAAAGADWIEVDAQFVAGTLLAFHDATLERTTNGRGPLTALPLAALLRLDAGDGERIPFLWEIIEALGPERGLNIELKGPDTAAAVAALVHKYVHRGWHYSRFLVSSFDHAELARLHRLAPRIPVGALVSRLPVDWGALQRRLDARSLHVPLALVNRVLVRRAHARGVRILVYTVDQRRHLARVRAMGVDGVFSNDPGRVLGWLGRKARGGPQAAKRRK
ncbi:MAG: glycerophosphodiester phosphodiesterase family protein [Gammaproteobacteria bacterium]|nr:glycerophosphodiester phosphodiesterase family protein [Gammaproteobacteria bacterium]